MSRPLDAFFVALDAIDVFVALSDEGEAVELSTDS